MPLNWMNHEMGCNVYALQIITGEIWNRKTIHSAIPTEAIIEIAYIVDGDKRIAKTIILSE